MWHLLGRGPVRSDDEYYLWAPLYLRGGAAKDCRRILCRAAWWHPRRCHGSRGRSFFGDDCSRDIRDSGFPGTDAQHDGRNTAGPEWLERLLCGNAGRDRNTARERHALLPRYRPKAEHMSDAKGQCRSAIATIWTLGQSTLTMSEHAPIDGAPTSHPAATTLPSRLCVLDCPGRGRNILRPLGPCSRRPTSSAVMPTLSGGGLGAASQPLGASWSCPRPVWHLGEARTARTSDS